MSLSMYQVGTYELPMAERLTDQDHTARLSFFASLHEANRFALVEFENNHSVTVTKLRTSSDPLYGVTAGDSFNLNDRDRFAHPWQCLESPDWVELYADVAADLMRAEGVRLDKTTGPDGSACYTEDSQQIYNDYTDRAERLMVDAGYVHERTSSLGVGGGL